jgi:soluble lytic murein transglycosylase-like protein
MAEKSNRKYPAFRRGGGHFAPLVFALVFGGCAWVWPLAGLSLAGSNSSYKAVEYINFDPNGRLGTLQQETEAAGAGKLQRMDRDVIIQTIIQAASEEGTDPVLVLAVAMAESRLDPRIISPRGAVGLMQLMPHTAKRFGCANPYNAYQNAACGARLLGFLLDRYNGNLPLALAAYNAGTAPVDRLAEIPPIGETQAFVQKVLQLVDEFRLELP